MKKQPRRLAISVALAIGATLVESSTFAQPVDTARIDAGGQNDWLTYHGSYKSWHYSPLAQINTNNVSNLSVAWIHIQDGPLAGCSQCRSWRMVCSTTRAPTAELLR